MFSINNYFHYQEVSESETLVRLRPKMIAPVIIPPISDERSAAFY